MGEVPKCHRPRRSTGDHDSEQDEQRNDTHQPEQSEGTHVRHVLRPDSWNQDGGGGEGRKRHRIEHQEQRRQLQAIHQPPLRISVNLDCAETRPPVARVRPLLMRVALRPRAVDGLISWP